MARKQKKYNFIYKTTNILSGKYYYGMHSTENLDDGYMGSGKRLRYSINTHGKHNHKREIIEFCKTIEELKKREEEIVNLNEIAKKDCLNLVVGGTGGFTYEQSIISGKIAVEILKKKRKDPEWVTMVSNNIKKVLSTPKARKANTIRQKEYYKSHSGHFKGKTHTSETKQKISNKLKGTGAGTNNSSYGTRWIYNIHEKRNLRVNTNELTKYINLGWIIGTNPEYYNNKWKCTQIGKEAKLLTL